MLVRAPLRLVATGAAASLVIALSLAPFAIRAQAEEDASATIPVIYKWVDENGIAHYTTDRSRIPGEIRDRVEPRAEVATQSPGDSTPSSRDDAMRDAVPTQSATGTPLTAPAPSATAVSDLPAPNPGAPAPAVAMPEPPATTTEIESVDVETTEIEAAPVEESEPLEEAVQIASPTPLSQDMQEATSAVSAPPPAPAAPIGPDEQAQLSELDAQIATVLEEIDQREETLAILISSADEQREIPLVDDPQFREISQRLPKLQADLQTLRERRNKIQPAAATP